MDYYRAVLFVMSVVIPVVAYGRCVLPPLPSAKQAVQYLEITTDVVMVATIKNKVDYFLFGPGTLLPVKVLKGPVLKEYMLSPPVRVANGGVVVTSDINDVVGGVGDSVFAALNGQNGDYVVTECSPLLLNRRDVQRHLEEISVE